MILSFNEFHHNVTYAPLYHSTDQLIPILERNIIWDNTGHINKHTNLYDHGVSLSRVKDFTFYGKDFTLILNQNKLRHKYKFKPIDFFYRGSGKYKHHKNRNLDEYEHEEFLLGTINPLNKYLLGIRINNEKAFNKVLNDSHSHAILVKYSDKYHISLYYNDYDVTEMLKSGSDARL